MCVKCKISEKSAKIRRKSKKKSQKMVDLMEQSPDEPNAGLEPAASRLEVSRATIALAGPLVTRLLEKRCDW
jgi:hypothetical protein